MIDDDGCGDNKGDNETSCSQELSARITECNKVTSLDRQFFISTRRRHRQRGRSRPTNCTARGHTVVISPTIAAASSKTCHRDAHLGQRERTSADDVGETVARARAGSEEPKCAVRQ